jgi:prepilin-type N-terminal cleavage/methylation domain-containing protein
MRDFSPRPEIYKCTRSGFTLIELLIVVTISAFLSGLVIIYGSVGRNEVSLSVESTAVGQLLARARSLAVATYANPNGVHTCAYGIVFDRAHNTYSLIGYEGPAGLALCPDASKIQAGGVVAGDLITYSPSTWQVPLAGGIRFDPARTADPLSLSLVLFYPPNPTVLLSATSCASTDAACHYSFGNQSGNVYLVTGDGAASNVITVGLGGQISW